MVDDKDAAREFGTHLPEEYSQLGGLRVVQACCRFVEQKHLGLACERTPNLNPSLMAVWQLRDGDSGFAFKPELADKALDHVMLVLPPTSSSIHAHRDVLGNSQLWKQLKVLKGSPQTCTSPPYTSPVGNVLPLKGDLSGGARHRPANAIHQSRLARTIGADESEHLVNVQIEINPRQRLHAAELTDEPPNTKKRSESLRTD